MRSSTVGEQHRHKSKWGACDFCMNLSLTLCLLGLLVVGLGTGTHITILSMIGGAAAILFGAVFATHVVFFFLRDAVPEVDQEHQPTASQTVASRGCGCSSR